MAERSGRRRLEYIYQQNGVGEKMSLTFNSEDLLKPIININGSIFEGRVFSTISHRGNRKTSFLKIEFRDDKLPRGVEHRNISFDLVEFLPLTIGLLGLSTLLILPILSSEQLKTRINHGVDVTQEKISVSKEKIFTKEELRLIRELIAQLEKEKSTTNK